MSAPEPEPRDTISVSVPVLLELEGLRLQAPCRVYVVWRLEGSPAGDFTCAGVHSGFPSWEGIQSVLASGAYVRGRDRLRRVEVPAGGDALEAARLLYFEEQQLHGAPSRLRIWYWPCEREAQVCRRLQERRNISVDTTQNTPSTPGSARRRRS
eukprot:193500-Amphidinium_carterae.1